MKQAVFCAVAVVLSAWSFASAAEQVALGGRYFDRADGFSLRPPAGANRRTSASSKRLATWWERDPSSGAIAWTLSVLRAEEPNAPADLGQCSQVLAERLRKRDGFGIESDELISAAGRQAVDLRGTVRTGDARLWHRQTWLPKGNGEFLILSISGAPAAKEQLNAILQTVLDTLELSDPDSLAARRQDNLNRGKALLASLEGPAVQKALAAEPQWFLFTYQGLDVGFMCAAESPQRREGVEGFCVRTWTMLMLPSQPVRHAEAEMFCSSDRRSEEWTESLLLGAGPRADRLAERGRRQDELITCHLTHGTAEQVRRKTLTATMQEQYLPKALGMMLARSVDLGRPQAYAFAVYIPARDDFDVRTFTVGAKEEIATGGKRLEAVRATDRPAEDAEEAVLWLDPGGKLLRMQTAEGCIMEYAGLGDIARRFPEAAEIAKKAGQ
jgi:hypothetical protein